MKNDNYIILINKEGSPVLVEVPEKPKPCNHDASNPCYCAVNLVDYEIALHKALSDTRSHIQFKDWIQAGEIILGNRSILPYNSLGDYFQSIVGQTFPLPSNVSVSFEEECRLGTTDKSVCKEILNCICLHDGERTTVAILTESTRDDSLGMRINIPSLEDQNPLVMEQESRTAPTIKEFLGEVFYDSGGQMIFAKQTKDGIQLIGNVNGLEEIISVRGWGKIQHLFKNNEDAYKFQDELGQFMADAINNKIKDASRERVEALEKGKKAEQKVWIEWLKKRIDLPEAQWQYVAFALSELQDHNKYLQSKLSTLEGTLKAAEEVIERGYSPGSVDTSGSGENDKYYEALEKYNILKQKVLSKEEILEGIFYMPESRDWYKPVLKAMQEYFDQQSKKVRDKAIQECINTVCEYVEWSKGEFLRIELEKLKG